MMGYENFARGWVKALVALLIRTIANENARATFVLQFSAAIR